MSKIKHPDFMYLRKLEDYEVVERFDFYAEMRDDGSVSYSYVPYGVIGKEVVDLKDNDLQAFYRICEPPEDEPATDTNNLSFSIGLVIGVLSVTLLWLCVSFVN